MTDDQPADCLRQGRQSIERRSYRLVWRCAISLHQSQAVRFSAIRQVSQSSEPVAIGRAAMANERLEQAQRHPLMPIGIRHRFCARQFLLESRIGLAEVMKQRRQAGQQTNILERVPVVLVVVAQYIARRGVGRHRALRVEAATITHNPQQLRVILAPEPMTGDRRVLACSLAQQAIQGLQSLLGDGRLPGPIAATLGELVEDAAGFGEGILGALRDQQDIHAVPLPRSCAIALSESIMKSSASARVRDSMQD